MPMNWGTMPLEKVKIMIGGQPVEAYVTSMTMDYSVDVYGIEWMTYDGIHGTATVARKDVVAGAFPPTIIADSVYKSYPQPFEKGSTAVSSSMYAHKKPAPAEQPPADLSQIEADLAKLPQAHADDEWNLGASINSATLSSQSLTEVMDSLTEQGASPLLTLPEQLKMIVGSAMHNIAETTMLSHTDELKEVLAANKVISQYQVVTPGIGPIELRLSLEVIAV